MPTVSKILAPHDNLIDFLTFLIDILLLSDLDCNDICNANLRTKLELNATWKTPAHAEKSTYIFGVSLYFDYF